MQKYLIFTILFNLLGCISSSTIDIQISSSSLDKFGSEISMSSPSQFFASSSDSITFTLSKTNGVLLYNSALVNQSSPTGAVCRGPSVNKIDNKSVQITFTNCTGDGGIIFSYGNLESIEVHIDNTTEDKFLSSFGVTINNSNNKFFVVDSALDALIEVDLLTGNKTTLSSSTVGTGTNFQSPLKVVLNAAEDEAFIIDNGAIDSLVRVNLSTGNRTTVSNNSTGTGTNFNNPTRLVLNSTEDKAYVIDRGTESIVRS